MDPPRAFLATLLLGSVTAAGCAVMAESGAPLPGVYGLDAACVHVPVQGRSEGASLHWCVDAVVVAANGDLEVRTSWAPSLGASLDPFAGIEKGGDASNRKMYLEDDRGRRYDHYDTAGAARYGGRLVWDGRLQGAYSFRARRPGSARFSFHDEDQGVVIQFALDAARRVSPEERAAVTDAVRTADEVEIEDAWGGLGPRRHQQWRLKRTRSGWTGDKDVPAPIAQEFFDLLAAAPLTRGQYVPRFSHTDDYPSLHIRFRRGQEVIEFSTESQGEGHVPWKVVKGGDTLVVPSDHPDRALALLRSFLTGKGPPPPREARR
jgi:hypothetical protein